MLRYGNLTEKVNCHPELSNPVAFEGAMTGLCGGSVIGYIICMFACARFGFNGDVILSVAYF
jgi:hypothetical protein